MLTFNVNSQDTGSGARTGSLALPHGTVETPVFAPVATRASIKGLLPRQVLECGSQMLLANTYHLELTPGADLVADLGELHQFMGWDRPILTDSGGYQVFSLAELRDISDEGVEFKSPRDGSTMFLGPREAMKIQEALGSDIAMVLDECPPCPCSIDEARTAVERTIKWARTCQSVHTRSDQSVFAICQGGTYEELRAECARQLADMNFEGYAIGGVSVGEDEEDRRRVVEFTSPMLPRDKPRYLMGVGFPEDVLHAVAQGIDMFDCVAPTRMGRNATAFTHNGRVRMRNSQHKRASAPVEDGCDCRTCRLYSRGYIHHLFRTQEMLGPVLLTIHNLHFYHTMMHEARTAINNGLFSDYRTRFLNQYNRKESN